MPAATSRIAPQPSAPDIARHLAYTSYLRVGAMVAVVLIHVAGPTLNAVDDGTVTWWVAAVLNFSTKWCVPVFVMVSGALLLTAPRDPSPSQFYRRRLSRIGIPLVFWHAVYITLVELTNPDATIQRHLADLIGATNYTALYFFWLILGLYLVTPLLWPLTSAWSTRGLVLAGIGLTLVPMVDMVVRRWAGALGFPITLGDPTFVTQFVPFVGYFVLGHALRDVVLRGRALAAAWTVAVVLAVAAPVQVAWQERIQQVTGLDLGLVNPLSYHGPSIALCSVLVFVAVRSTVNASTRLAGPRPARVMRRLGDLTLGVFGSHLLVFYVLSRALGHDAPVGARTVPGVIGLCVAVIVLSFVVSAVLRWLPLLRRTV